MSPTRLEYNAREKTGAVSVVNEEDKKLQMQIKAMEWTQNSEGKDQYAETSDILYFPRILVFDKKGEKIIRVGTRMPLVAKEKTYRLFIEEIPGPSKAEGSRVAIAVKFALPIFIQPAVEQVKGEIAQVTLAKGVASALIRNTGNVHFRIMSINFKGINNAGVEAFSKKVEGWYLLSDTSRSYSVPIPKGDCQNAAKLVIEVETDKTKITNTVNIEKSMCLP